MCEEQCKTCHFNRPVWGWGELIPDACWYGRDTSKDLYSLNDMCSGYEEKEKQLELAI